MKERKKLSKLKNDKKLKGVVKTLDKVVGKTSTDNIQLTTINQMQYTAALLITNKITPPKPTTNRKPRGGPPAWQQRLQKQIDQLRGDISIITVYTNGNTTNKIRRKLKTILKKHKVTVDEQLIACKEDLKQALQAKVQRLRRYTKRSEQNKCNKMFREDSKRFYRELGKMTIQIEKPPDIREVKKFLAEHTGSGGQTQWGCSIDKWPGGRNAANQPDGVEGPHSWRTQGSTWPEQPTRNHLDLTDSPTSGSSSWRASTNPWQRILRNHQGPKANSRLASRRSHQPTT